MSESVYMLTITALADAGRTGRLGSGRLCRIGNVTHEESQRVLALRETGPLAGVTSFRRSRRGDALARHTHQIWIYGPFGDDQVLAHELLNSGQRRASQ